MEIKLDFERHGNKYSTQFSYKTECQTIDLKRPVLNIIKEIMNKPPVKKLLEEHSMDDIRYIQEYYTIIDNDLPLEKFKSQTLTVVCNKKYCENDTNLCSILCLIFFLVGFFIFLVVSLAHYK